MDLLEKYSLRFLTVRGTNPLKSTITAKIMGVTSIIAYILLIISLIYSIIFTITEIPAIVDNVTGIAIVYQVYIHKISTLCIYKSFRHLPKK